MTIEDLLQDKTKKIKEKTETISRWLLDGSMPADELLAFAEKTKDSHKATCIEAFEYATKHNPAVVDATVFDFVIKSLTEKAPRVKWESARVIGTTANLHPEKLADAIPKLLSNAQHNGTVVRWASSYALAEILKLKTKHNAVLLPAVQALYESEVDNAIRKKYAEAFQMIGK